MFRKILFSLTLVLTLFFCCHQVQAQQSKVDIFIGADLKYRSIWLNDKMYEFLINLTPGVKWQFGDNWQLTAQAHIPIVNHYGDYYKIPRINMAVLSKELQVGQHYFKFSGGLFSMERFGLDAKWFWPLSSWFALEAQLGYTGCYSFATADWGFSHIDRLTGLLTLRFYIESCETEFRLSGGRFNLADYGGRVEWFRHFGNISVGVYLEGGNRYGKFEQMNGAVGTRRYGGGAKLIVMLPWQGTAERKHTVRFRPASNLRFTYNHRAEVNALKTYTTDPEENERIGNFYNVKWGIMR